MRVEHVQPGKVYKCSEPVSVVFCFEPYPALEPVIWLVYLSVPDNLNMLGRAFPATSEWWGGEFEEVRAELEVT